MKKALISLAASVSLSFGYDIAVGSGWSLVGVPSAISSAKLSNSNPKLTRLWVYRNGAYVDATANDVTVQPYEGLWVLSPTAMTVSTAEDSGAQGNRSDAVNIVSGWNLLSLPVESIVSPRLFGQNKVFKYKSGAWYIYDPTTTIDANATPPAPPIDFIGKNEGFWLYSDKNTTLYISDEAAKLQNFTDKATMTAFIKNMVILNRNYKSDQSYYPMPVYAVGGGIALPASSSSSSSSSSSGSMVAPPPAAAPSVGAAAPTATDSGSKDSGSSASNATSTNLQEKNVDEADIVKNDGTNIFYMSKFKQKIIVTTFAKVAANDSSSIASIKLKTDMNADSFFVSGGKLVITYGGDNGGYWGYWGSMNISYWSQKSSIEVYDISNLSNITKIADYKIDGRLVDSRIANGKLYLVTRYLPYIEVSYPKKYVDCTPYGGSSTTSSGGKVSVPPYSYGCYYPADDVGYYTYDYDNPVLKTEHLSATLTDTLTNKTTELFSPAKFFAPSKLDQQSFITSVTAFDLNNSLSVDNLSAIGGSDTLYASTNAIYTVSKNYPIYYSWRSYKDRSVIYKFDINGSLGAVKRGFIDGSVLNQFSLSEYAGALRVASSSSEWNGTTTVTNNSVYVLVDSNGSLPVSGKLSGLGKERESIKAVRFIGNRGFVVTFRNTDPLYTLDLSDVANPKKVGELSIPGYSSYFHPVDDSRILSIGRDANASGTLKGLQIQLFDISNFAAPRLADKVVFGDSYNYVSEAENNHLAFNYRNSDGLLAFDLRYYDCAGGATYDSCLNNALQVYQVNGMSLKKITTVDGEPESLYFQSPGYRSILFDVGAQSYAAYFSNGKISVKQVVK